MRNFLACLLLSVFMAGCAASSATKSSTKVEERQFSSVFYAVKLTSSDGWQTATMEDSDGDVYELKKKDTPKGLFLVADNKRVNIHIKGQNALLQNSMGEFFVLEEAK